jgi:nicotinate-nucleotide adenylyltransferase
LTGLFGGAFDPPHTGHVTLASAAKQHFGLARFVVLVSARPGHRDVAAPPEVRVRMAEAAFPFAEVRLDPHARTVDLLRAEPFDDPIFLVGADQFRDFLAWKEPSAVLELARLGVATRPGYARGELDDVLAALPDPSRVEFFEIEPVPVSGTMVRARVARGEGADGLVPSAVAAIIEELGLYRDE